MMMGPKSFFSFFAILIVNLFIHNSKEYFKVDVWGLQSKAKKMQTFKNVARNAPILVLTTMAMPSP
jgi:hypothetical protein